MAGGSLGTLTIDLIAKIAGFTDGLDKAERKAKKSASDIEASFNRLNGVLQALGAGAAVGLFVNWIGGALEFADASQEAASASGVLTNEFLKLSGAAVLFGQAGVDVQKALVSLGEQIAKNDSSLTSLGIATRDASGQMRSSYDVMLDVADVFAKMPDGVEKTTMAVDIFGKKIGPGLVPLLNQGSEAIDGVSGSIAQLSEGMKAAQGEWEVNSFKMSEAFNMLRNSIAESVVPIANDFYAWALKLGPVLKPIGDAMSTLATIAGVIITGALKGLVTLFTLIASGAITAAHALTGFVNVGLNLIALDADGMAASLEQMSKAIMENSTATKDALAALWDLDGGAAKEAAKQTSADVEAIDKERVAKFAESLKTAKQKEMDVYAERLAEAKYFADAQVLGAQEKNALIEKEYADHLARLAAIDKKAQGKPKEKSDSEKAAEEEAKRRERELAEALASTRIVPWQQGLDEMAAASEAFRVEQAAADEFAAQMEQSKWADELAGEVETGQMKIESDGIVADAKEKRRREELNGTQEMLGNLSVLMNSHSKKAFEVGKIAAIASAIVNTAVGATKALAQGGFLGIGMAAAVIAAGLVQIQSIRAQQFSGSGSPAASPTANVNAASTPVGEAGVGSSRNVYVHGIERDSLYSGQQLLDIINSAIRDGGTLRQASV